MFARLALYALTLLSAYQVGKEYGPQIDQYLQGNKQPPPVVHQVPVDPVTPGRRKVEQRGEREDTGNERIIIRERIIERRVPAYGYGPPPPSQIYRPYRPCGPRGNGPYRVYYYRY